MDNSKIEESEWYGRNIFEKYLKSSNITDYEFSSDQYSIWDCIYTTDKLQVVVEIKVRNNNSNDYPDWILELKKYNALIDKVNELQPLTDKKVIAVYVNFFNDNFYSIWNLENVDITKVKKLSCKRSTVYNNGYVNKEIIPLLLNDAFKSGWYEK